MKSKITIEKTFNLENIKLDLSKELNEAGRVIRDDHGKRLERGRGVNGARMENLKPSTIERKGFDQILVHTGDMKNLVIEKATKGKQEVVIKPGDEEERNGVTNQRIGYYHQTGAGRLPKREWFGISKGAEKRAFKIIELKIERVLRNA